MKTPPTSHYLPLKGELAMFMRLGDSLWDAGTFISREKNNIGYEYTYEIHGKVYKGYRCREMK